MWPASFLPPAPSARPVGIADPDRLSVLAQYDIADCLPEAAFDHIVELAAPLFATSAAMISVVTGDSQFFKARTGLDACEISPDISFCVHALDRHEPLVVEDALLDPRFAANPLVLGPPFVRFYAGMPLRVESGHVLGTLCIIDQTPRRFDAEQRRLLEQLARIVVDQFELRRSRRQGEAHERHLAFLAHVDQLTGLPNRTHFNEMVGTSLSAHPTGTLLLFDLDGFKDVNDVFGHAVGDQLLVEVGARLTGLLEPGHLLARLGGDEFVVFLPGVSDPRHAYAFAEKLRSGFATGFTVEDQELRVETCIGIALAPYHGQDVAELLCHADLALYRAKERGGGSIGYYEPHLRRQVQDRQTTQNELQRAFATGEFELLYQPQVGLPGGALTGVEALLRWRHPEHGLLPPAAFLKTLELMPLAARVGEWVLASAMQQAACWAAAGRPLRVGINLSASQFLSGSLPEQVAAELSRHALDPALVEFEITETIAIKNKQLAVALLDALRRLGVGIALDDFGTGYASLSLLKEFPVTRLKIDRDFITGVESRTADAAVVDSVLRLSRAFGLTTIAEGVETPEQRDWLTRAGCEEGQGYLFGRPMSVEEIDALFDDPPVALRA